LRSIVIPRGKTCWIASVEPGRQLNRVRAGLFLDTDDDGGFAVAGSFAALQRATFADIRQIAHEDGAAAAQRHGGFSYLLRASDASDCLEHVLLGAFDVHTR
jgi:hypothetical protein